MIKYTVILAMALLGCTTMLQKDFERTLANPTEDKAILHKAIKSGCMKRKWVCKEESEGTWHASLHSREHVVKVKIMPRKDSINYQYVSSANMRYDGTHIHRKYHVWLKMLHDSIDQSLFDLQFL